MRKDDKACFYLDFCFYFTRNKKQDGDNILYTYKEGEIAYHHFSIYTLTMLFRLPRVV
jgi:hypothetical protein